MKNASTSVAMVALFAAMAGLYLAGPRRTTVEYLRRSAAARGLLRAFAWFALGLGLWGLGHTLGWEIGVPAGLGLCSVAAIANLYLAAVSHRAHAAAGAATALLTLAGVAALTAAHTLS